MTAKMALNAVLLVLAGAAFAQGLPPDRPTNTPNAAPNGYNEVSGFLMLPPGRVMGSSSAVSGDSQGHIWVVDRCGANDCAASKLDPVMEFNADGKFLRSWGAGKFLFPHGFFIDAVDHLWITDGHVDKTRGDTVMEFTRDGKLLRTLGKPGVSGADAGTFHEPNAVLVTKDSIFVSDGHLPEKGNARVIKFDAAGKFLKTWGGHGRSPGQFEMPHCLTMDAAGRLYVGDRDNARIQIFTPDGKLLRVLNQFGRPSGCFIRDGKLYVTDSESRETTGYGHHPGWHRGIRIANLKDGVVTDFIPDDEPNPDAASTSGGEGIWVDAKGAIYSAQVLQKRVVKYVRR